MPQVTASLLSRWLNRIPIAVMSFVWSTQILVFWIQFGAVAWPGIWTFCVCTAVSLAPLLLPDSYFVSRLWERDARLYKALGVKWFRAWVPDGDGINRLVRRSHPGYRVLTGSHSAVERLQGGITGEKAHLVLLLIGQFTAARAAALGWWRWSVWLTLANVLCNLYPILLQRYTRARLRRTARYASHLALKQLK